LSDLSTSSRKLVASRIMLRCRNRSATVLKSSGGGFWFPIWIAMFTAPLGLFMSVDCSRYE
jgi:hypothetical protein